MRGKDMFVEEVIPAIVEKYESFTKVEQVIEQTI